WPGREFAAEVLRVYLYPTIESNVVTYTTVLGGDNPDEDLLPGMTATATITTDTREQVVRVPNAALRFKPSSGPRVVFSGPGGRSGADADAGSSVWILEDGQPERIRVATGYTDGRYTEILNEALSPGDEVLVG